MLPSASMMKPLPAPRRGTRRPRREPPADRRRDPAGRHGVGARPRRPALRRAPATVASMFTTAGLIRSTTSAKLTSDPAALAGAPPAALAAPDDFGAAASIDERCTPPATMIPTRKADDGGEGDGDEREAARHMTSSLSIIRARNAASSSVSTPSCRAFSSLLPASLPATTIAGLLADRPGTFAPSRSSACGGLLARHRRQRAGQHEHLPGERARLDRSGSGAWLVMLTPAAARRADEVPIARLVGERAHRRGDDRADLGRRLQRLDRRVEQRGPSSGSGARASPRPSRRRAGCRARRSAATDRSILLRSICSMTLRPTLPSLRGTGALGSRLARRDDQLLELRRRRGGRGPRSRGRAPARSADRRATRRALRCSSPTRDAKCSRLRRMPRRAGRVLAAPDHFLVVAVQRAAAHRAGRRHLPRLGRGVPSGCGRIA